MGSYPIFLTDAVFLLFGFASAIFPPMFRSICPRGAELQRRYGGGAIYINSIMSGLCVDEIEFQNFTISYPIFSEGVVGYI